MMRHTYDKEITALPVIDPYNDFIAIETPRARRGDMKRAEYMVREQAGKELRS